MDVVDSDRYQQHGVVCYEMGLCWAASRKGPEQFHRLSWVFRAVYADSPRKVLEQRFVTRGEARQHLALELVIPVAKEFVDMVRNVEHPVGQPDQYRRNQQGLGSLSLNGGKHLLEVIKPIGAIPMRGDDRLVLDRKPDLGDVWFSVRIGLTDEQVNPPLSTSLRNTSQVSWRSATMPSETRSEWVSSR